MSPSPVLHVRGLCAWGPGSLWAEVLALGYPWSHLSLVTSPAGGGREGVPAGGCWRNEEWSADFMEARELLLTAVKLVVFPF